MDIIPTGAVTFLFTDIEGSTILAQKFPDAIPDVMHKHHSILTDAIQSNNGFIFEVPGDAFCCAFENAGDAVKAAIDAQSNLTNEKWNEAVIKVRMGIHSGNADWNGKRYLDYITMARAARVMSVAYGGQILISDNARSQINNETFPNVSFRDLGIRRLKDLIQTVKLYQIISPGLQEDFPPLKTIDLRPNNLPFQLTNFIGKENEIAEIKKHLDESHLLTLTGAGGSGKTRLALQVGADLIDEFEHGVWFVELAPLLDAELLPQTIIKSLSINENPMESVEETLFDFLKDKKMLLILDNCEHLINAAADLTQKLLIICPGLKIIATSREALRCDGEIRHRVMPLKYPETESGETPESLNQYESVSLFIDRALAVNTEFRVNNNNAPAVAEICSRLEGIPMAIELAAARIKVLSPEKILERLQDRFALLSGGKRTALPRQQTLKALIDWSYDLLSENEKILWHRLSLFAGGWTLEAAENICSGERIAPEEILDILTDLSEKSIIIFEDDKERFKMFETIRQYGENKLKETGEHEIISMKHLKYFTGLAGITANSLRGEENAFLMNMFDNESKNIERALLFSLNIPANENAIKLSGGMSFYWQHKGYLTEGIRWLDAVVSKSAETRSTYYLKAISSLGNFWRLRGDLKKAREYISRSLIIARNEEDKDNISDSRHRLAIIEFDSGNFDEAQKLYEENLKYYESIEFKSGIARTLNNLANVLSIKGDYVTATSMYEKCLAIRREIKDNLGAGFTLCNLGILAQERGDYDAANKLLDESLQIRRVFGETGGIIITLTNIGNVACSEGEFDKAEKAYAEAYKLSREIENKKEIAEALNNLGRVSIEKGETGNAVKLIEESLSIAREIHTGPQIAMNLEVLGEIAFQSGQYQTAKDNYYNALEILVKEKNMKEMISVILNLAELNAVTGNYYGSAVIIGFIKEEFLGNKNLKFGKTMQSVFDKTLSKLNEKMKPTELSEFLEKGGKMISDEAITFALSLKDKG